MGRQRDLSDLWGRGFSRFSTEVKTHYGFNEKCHVRYCEDRSGRCVVYVVKRSGPSRGFDVGNFAVDASALRWMIRQLNAGKINSAYVALVEDYGGEVATWDTAKNVRTMLGEAEPYTGSSGSQYWWVSDKMVLVGSPLGADDVITDPPF